MKLKSDGYTDQNKLAKSIDSILSKNKLMALSTCADAAKPRVCPVFYSHDDDLNLYFISDPKTVHIHQIVTNDYVCAAIYDSSQEWMDDKAGLQIFGTCELIEATDMEKVGIKPALKTYLKRFPDSAKYMNSDNPSRFYVIIPEKIKIFDEKTFGDDTFIDVFVS